MSRPLKVVRPSISGQTGPVIIGSSPAVQRSIQQATALGHTGYTVLIRGETGTGKELFARLIHEKGRPGAPFVAVNCATLGGELLEAELFGHIKGAFTGASQDREGLVRQAGGGTLFLDEVGELSLEAQASLLRVLQEKTVRPVGSSRELPVDVRIVAATHRDLEAMISMGSFRSDLYFRLAESVIRIPPLSERLGDVPAIARYYLSQLQVPGGRRRVLTHHAARLLTGYVWPGNVRELKTVLQRLCLETRGRYIRAYRVARILGIEVDDIAQILPRNQVLGQLNSGLELGAADLSARLKYPRSSLQRQLNDLVLAGLVMRSGAGNRTRYRKVVHGNGNDSVSHSDHVDCSDMSSGVMSSEARSLSFQQAIESVPVPEPGLPHSAVHAGHNRLDAQGAPAAAGCAVDAGGLAAIPEHSEVLLWTAPERQRLLELVEAHGDVGCSFSALESLMERHSRNEIKGMLRSLKSGGLIHARGRTRSARWYVGPPRASDELCGN